MSAEIDIRALEQESIQVFVEQCASKGFLKGSVLDFGCGKQPWRTIIEAAGSEYTGYDRVTFPANVSGRNIGPDIWKMKFDTVISTQCLQYWSALDETLSELRLLLNAGGSLLLTGPYAWPLVEQEDRWHLTPFQVRVLLLKASFRDVLVEPRGQFSFAGEKRWYTGWQAVARL